MGDKKFGIVWHLDYSAGNRGSTKSCPRGRITLDAIGRAMALILNTTGARTRMGRLARHSWMVTQDAR